MLDQIKRVSTRTGRDTEGGIRDERALHILLHRSKWPEHQPRASLSPFLSLCHSLCWRDCGGEIRADRGTTDSLTNRACKLLKMVSCVCGSICEPQPPRELSAVLPEQTWTAVVQWLCLLDGWIRLNGLKRLPPVCQICINEVSDRCAPQWCPLTVNSPVSGTQTPAAVRALSVNLSVQLT